MSKFSGEYDVYDIVCVGNDSKKIQQIISSTTFCIMDENKNRIKLDIQSQKDLIPYYAYTINKNNKGICILSNDSYVNHEEHEYILALSDIMKKYYRKCKRNKKEYKVEDALAIIASNNSYLKEVAMRISVYGSKADIKGIHDPRHDYLRGILYDEMIAAGYTHETAIKWTYNYQYDANKPRIFSEVKNAS